MTTAGPGMTTAVSGMTPVLLRCSTRSARLAAASECVTSTSDAPCERLWSISASITRAAVLGSRLPVGSSASSRLGLCTSARAIATRCNCPPLSCCGRRPPKPARPTASSIACTRASSCWPSSSRGSATFCATSRCGNTWKAWNTKPVFSRRKRAFCSSFRRPRSCPSRITLPLSQVSSPAMQLSRVDLPTPDSPTMATNSPSRTVSETWLKTATSP